MVIETRGMTGGGLASRQEDAEMDSEGLRGEQGMKVS